MLLLKAETRHNAPDAWVKIIRTLRQGGMLRSVPHAVPTFERDCVSRHYSQAFCFTWLHEVFHNAVRELNIDRHRGRSISTYTG